MTSPPNSEPLRNWSLLRASPIFSVVQADWTGLLANKLLKEESYQKFISDHAGLFFSQGPSMNGTLVVSKLRLGSDYITDFVLVRGARSLGVNYELIEIESPHDPVFVRQGHASSNLTAAVQQVHDWRKWIEKNREEAKRIFPSKEFIRGDDPNFTYTVVIGKRNGHVDDHARRNEYARTNGVAVRSFDYLSDLLTEMHFNPLVWISRDIVPNISALANNRFSNPFFFAYSDPEWRTICRRGDFSCSHTVANNLDLLLEQRQYNSARLSAFDAFLQGLPEEERRIPKRYYDYLDLT